jgi:hypothetical protein
MFSLTLTESFMFFGVLLLLAIVLSVVTTMEKQPNKIDM